MHKIGRAGCSGFLKRSPSVKQVTEEEKWDNQNNGYQVNALRAHAFRILNALQILAKIT